MRRFAASHHRPFDSLPVPDAGGPTVPDPYIRIRASAIGAGNLARQMAQNERAPEWVRNEATKILLLMSDVPYDIDAVKDLVDCYQRDMLEMCEEGIQMARENTALRAQLEGRSTPGLPIPLSREPHRAASGE
jgi:hypothetical protein